MPGDSKTEKATPKKREDERKKGNVFLSKDITSVISLLAIFYSLKFLFPSIYANFSNFILRYIGYVATKKDISETFAGSIGIDVMIAFAKIAMPLMLIVIVVDVAITFAQTRMLVSFESLKPKFSKLNPLQGIKRLISMKSFVEIIKGLIKIAIIIYILYQFFLGKLTLMSKTLYESLMESVMFVLNSVMELVVNISLIFVFVSLLDYFYQWWEYEKNMKMSKQEIKEEYKQLEGDPQVKGKIKEKQRKMAMSRMMQSVPSADVVLRNPTHYAVALRYDIKRDNAPIVVAKGQDELALRIVKVAEQHDIYVMENKPLARAIYATADINTEIPMEYYGAVAEILALVYKIKNKDI